MMARLQDVLHLAAWNGYSEDIAPAVPLTKETWTDERLVFPFGIQQTYGGGKTRIQILIENGAFDRVQELMKMAVNTHHLPILKKVINSKDNTGETALTAAIKTRDLPIVKLLVKFGADINQVNKKGRSALNLAITCMKEKESSSKPCPCSEPPKGWDLTNSRVSMKSKTIVSYLSNLGAIDIPEEVEIMRNRWAVALHEIIFMRNERMHYEWDDWNILLRTRSTPTLTRVLPDAPEAPKPKKLKASLYKQQFGRR